VVTEIEAAHAIHLNPSSFMGLGTTLAAGDTDNRELISNASVVRQKSR
jgi:hypothetical protein